MPFWRGRPITVNYRMIVAKDDVAIVTCACDRPYWLRDDVFVANGEVSADFQWVASFDVVHSRRPDRVSRILSISLRS